jgi:hypothetical protein
MPQAKNLQRGWWWWWWWGEILRTAPRWSVPARRRGMDHKASSTAQPRQVRAWAGGDFDVDRGLGTDRPARWGSGCAGAPGARAAGGVVWGGGGRAAGGRREGGRVGGWLQLVAAVAVHNKPIPHRPPHRSLCDAAHAPCCDAARRTTW